MNKLTIALSVAMLVAIAAPATKTYAQTQSTVQQHKYASRTHRERRWFWQRKHEDKQTAIRPSGDNAGASSAVWHDVASGFEAAKQENKPIITDFTTSWCGWCKKMDRETFSQPAVQKLMSDNFVMVRANAEDGGSGQRLAEQNGINGFPTIMIFDAAGQPKAKLVGYKDAQTFSGKLNQYLQGTLKGDQ